MEEKQQLIQRSKSNASGVSGSSSSSSSTQSLDVTSAPHLRDRPMSPPPQTDINEEILVVDENGETMKNDSLEQVISSLIHSAKLEASFHSIADAEKFNKSIDDQTAVESSEKSKETEHSSDHIKIQDNSSLRPPTNRTTTSPLQIEDGHSKSVSTTPNMISSRPGILDGRLATAPQLMFPQLSVAEESNPSSHHAAASAQVAAAVAATEHLATETTHEGDFVAMRSRPKSMIELDDATKKVEEADSDSSLEWNHPHRKRLLLRTKSQVSAATNAMARHSAGAVLEDSSNVPQMPNVPDLSVILTNNGMAASRRSLRRSVRGNMNTSWRMSFVSTRAPSEKTSNYWDDLEFDDETDLQSSRGALSANAEAKDEAMQPRLLEPNHQPTEDSQLLFGLPNHILGTATIENRHKQHMKSSGWFIRHGSDVYLHITILFSLILAAITAFDYVSLFVYETPSIFSSWLISLLIFHTATVYTFLLSFIYANEMGDQRKLALVSIFGFLTFLTYVSRFILEVVFVGLAPTVPYS